MPRIISISFGFYFGDSEYDMIYHEMFHEKRKNILNNSQ